MDENGVTKVRSYRRKSEDERWNQEELGLGQGVPWEPVPGRNNIEAKSQFRYRDEEEDIIPMPGTRESIPRRIYITKNDVASVKYGLTEGCRGCEAANRGTVGIHNERCRDRIEQAISIKEFEKVIVKLSTHEEEKSEESTGQDETSSREK